jgi:hypothetical protein
MGKLRKFFDCFQAHEGQDKQENSLWKVVQGTLPKVSVLGKSMVG